MHITMGCNIAVTQYNYCVIKCQKQTKNSHTLRWKVNQFIVGSKLTWRCIQWNAPPPQPLKFPINTNTHTRLSIKTTLKNSRGCMWKGINSNCQCSQRSWFLFFTEITPTEAICWRSLFSQGYTGVLVLLLLYIWRALWQGALYKKMAAYL